MMKDMLNCFYDWLDEFHSGFKVSVVHIFI
jgi:hypothetical protein